MRSRPETIILKGNFDNTVLLQKTANGNFIRLWQKIVLLQPGHPAKYAEQKGRK